MNIPDKGLIYWSDQFEALQEQARSHGFSSVCLLVEQDPFDKSETKVVIHQGMGSMMMMGAGHYIRHLAECDLEESVHQTDDNS